MQAMTDILVKEFMDRLERNGHSDEYIDGALEGMSFAIEWLRGLHMLELNKNKYMREEWNVKTEISA